MNTVFGTPEQLEQIRQSYVALFEEMVMSTATELVLDEEQ